MVSTEKEEGEHSAKKMRKGLWSPDEDERLYSHITNYGVGTWSSVAQLAGLKRSGKSCRLRWLNYLQPDLKREPISKQEGDLIVSLQKLLGNRWSAIAARIPGRTDNEIKNYWNSRIRKKHRQRMRADGGYQSQSPEMGMGQAEEKGAQDSITDGISLDLCGQAMSGGQVGHGATTSHNSNSADHQPSSQLPVFSCKLAHPGVAAQNGEQQPSLAVPFLKSYQVNFAEEEYVDFLMSLSDDLPEI
ncbi:hypothetical protein BS78_08G018000 [Paspalum vaginatum]|nr:hypothetical protein BS78_08G018000 [Paspalum vaginatum]